MCNSDFEDNFIYLLCIIFISVFRQLKIYANLTVVDSYLGYSARPTLLQLSPLFANNKLQN